MKTNGIKYVIFVIDAQKIQKLISKNRLFGINVSYTIFYNNIWH